jgi:hypothetical protein
MGVSDETETSRFVNMAADAYLRTMTVLRFRPWMLSEGGKRVPEGGALSQQFAVCPGDALGIRCARRLRTVPTCGMLTGHPGRWIISTEMPKFIQLKTVARPELVARRTVIDFEAAGGMTMAGPDSEDVDLYCGQCGALIVTGIPKRNIRNSVVRCKLCREFNDPSVISKP